MTGINGISKKYMNMEKSQEKKEKTKWEIEGRYYSPDEMKWYYTDFSDMISYSEDELELAEEHGTR